MECWGGNGAGQLGNGTTTDSSTPVVVPGLTGVLAVAAAGWSTCALLGSGAVACWGDNTYGQLGDGTTTSSPVPVHVSNLANVTALTGGYGHMCALHPNGTVECWGYNLLGALGNGLPSACPPCGTSVPVPVVGLDDATGISAGAGGYFTCATRAGGSVTCWGDNTYGQLGSAGGTRSWTPLAVPGIGNALSVSAGGNQACALLADHSIACWGLGTSGQLGNGAASNSATPVFVSGVNDATMVVSGVNVSCAVKAGGGAACWGYNGWGQLGGSILPSSSVPVPVSTLTSVTSIAAGGQQLCARLTGGAVWCWGDDRYGQLGNRTTAFSFTTPVAVACSDTSRGAPDGDGCAAATDCASLHCIDGVCCANSCGGGDPSDCQACSRAAGGTTDGTCTAAVGHVCRPSAGACDVAESCNGFSALCPPDSFAPAATVCRPSAGPCDFAETCTGGSRDCPTDAFAPSFVVCHPSAGPCDVAETCSGGAAACPVDWLAPSTAVCRPSAGTCDLAETCTGTSVACPPDVLAAAGLTCHQAVCESTEVCSGTSATCPTATALPACGGSVQGTVSWNGAPVTGLSASGLRVSGGYVGQLFATPWSVAVDPSTGRFDSGSVAAGNWQVSMGGFVTCSGGEGSEGGGAPPFLFTSLSVSPSTTTTADFDLGSSFGLVTGSINGNGAPVQATITVDDGNCTSLATDADGHFAALLPAGNHSVTATTDSGSTLDTLAFTVLPGQDVELGAIGRPNGDPCASGDECATSFCTDGVCCGTSCGGGDATDCQACSVAAGAPTDGICAPLASTHLCHDVAGACDVAEFCDGSSLDCPTDRFLPATTVCRGPTGTCDVAEHCTGTSAACPPDAVLPAGTSCSTDLCVSAACSGGGPTCPAGTPLPVSICTSAVNDVSACNFQPACLDLLGGDATLGGVSLSFPSTWSGEVKAVSSSNGCPPPTGFQVLGTSQGATTGHYWDLQPTAGYPTPVTICIHYDPAWVIGSEQNVRIMHGIAAPDPATGCVLASAGWMPLTLSQPVNTTTHTVCAYTPSLSPFTLVEPLPASIPKVTVPSPLIVNATGSAGANLTFAATASDAQDGALVPICAPASGSTFPVGTTTVTCRATDHDGFVGTASFNVTVTATARDTTPPVFSGVPGSMVAYATGTSGAKVSYAKPLATDAVDGARPVTCTPASGSTFAPGKTTVTCTASDTHGNASRATFIIWVQYQAPGDGTFFLSPIRPDGTSIFRIGPPVPVEFKLTGASAGITNLAAKLIVTKLSGSITGTTSCASSETTDDSGMVFKYNAAAKVYLYRWKTSNQTQGTYQLRADLGDGVVHQISVSLRAGK